MRRFFCVVFIISATINSSFAQNTLAQDEKDNLFRTGLELLDKKEFGSARRTFEKFVSGADGDIRKADAEYYIAFCALGLYHGDGERLINSFIDSNPHHGKSILAFYELGSFYYGEKQYKKAIQYLSKADLNSLSPEQRLEARFKLGYSYFTQRSFDEALERFNAIKRQNSEYASAANYYAGYIEFQKGEYDQALKDFEQVKTSKSYAAEVPYMIANIYYKQKEYDQAISYVTDVLNENSKVKNKRDLQLLLAESHFRKSQYDKASTYFDQYLAGSRAKPKDDVSYRIAYAYYEAGESAKAISNFKQVASADDTIGVYASYYLGVLYLKENNKNYALTAFNTTRKTELNDKIAEEAAYQYAKVNYDLGKADESIDAFIEFTEKYPNSQHVAEVNDLLSEAYLSASNYNKAIAHIEGLSRKSKSLEKAYQKATYLKGTEFYNISDYQQAIVLFDKSLKYPIENDYFVKASFWRGESYMSLRNYEEAIPSYQNVLGRSDNRNSEYGVKSRYGIGYAYYNTKAYDKALIHFKEYVNQVQGQRRKQNYDDALIRLADCYYVTKSYNNALTYYRQAIKESRNYKDYAHVHAGIVLGIEGRVEEAKAEFDLVINRYKSSRHYANALFQKGQLDYEKGNYGSAINSFTKLINERPQSPYVPHAYSKRAPSYSNQSNIQKAVDDYTAIIQKFTTHQVASEALVPLQEALTNLNRSGDFDRYLEIYKRANPESGALEAVDFKRGETMYANQNYQGAISAFKDYIQKYDEGEKTVEAKYYVAESYYRMQDLPSALPYYYEIYRRGSFRQFNRVVQRIADIEFSLNQYNEAITLYNRLGELATNKRQAFNAVDGLMESYYRLAQYDSVDNLANRILAQGLGGSRGQNKASLYLGKSAYARGDYNTAQDEFVATVNSGNDVSGAEAKYLLGDIQFQQEQYRQSIETLIELNSDFNIHQEWVGKSYLLVVDNYIALEEYVQAR
ncbi:MAG: tetratricopeptide repeat protein, partial [Bacteroidota bacterium]